MPLTTRIALSTAAALAVLLSTAASAATVTSTSSLTTVTAGGAPSRLVTVDGVSDNVAVKTSSDWLSFSSLSKFDGSLGVLTDVSAGVDWGVSTLTAEFTTAGGKRGSADGTLTGALIVGSAYKTATLFSFHPPSLAIVGGNLRIVTPDRPPVRFSLIPTTDFIGTGALEASGQFTVSSNKISVDPANLTQGIYSLQIGSSAASGTLAVTYTYLAHSNASFDSRSNLDDLTVSVGQAFDVHALGTADGTIGLSSFDTQCSGDCTAIALDLNPFNGLSAGGRKTLSTHFSTQTPGQYAATYTLTFTDDFSVAGAGHNQNTLVLNVNGVRPVDPPPVPEPATLWMSLGGALLLWARSRRRSAR